MPRRSWPAGRHSWPGKHLPAPHSLWGRAGRCGGAGDVGLETHAPAPFFLVSSHIT